MSETKKGGVSRRGFIGGTIAAAAGAGALPLIQSAMPWGTAERSGGEVPSSAGILSESGRWYEALVESVTRGWESRFRFRQYRSFEFEEPEDEDYLEDFEHPQSELEDALFALPLLHDDATAHLILASSEQEYCTGSDDPTVDAADAMAQDVLACATRLGYFAQPCPPDLRFPYMPCRSGARDDFKDAERTVEDARGMVNLTRNTREGFYSAEEIAECEAKLEAAEKHLAAMRAGEIPAFTKEEKAARLAEQRREIVRAYRARLLATGVDASWVDVDGAGGREVES